MNDGIFHSGLEEAVAAEVMHISRKLSQLGAKVLEDEQVSVGQLPILHLLYNNGTMSQTQLSQTIRVTAATVSTTIKNMEKDGVVERVHDTIDGRVIHVSLTERGRKACESTMAKMLELYRIMMNGFTDEECEKIVAFVRRMSENLTASNEEA